MKKTKDELKSYFETGDRPTQLQFEDLIDSLIHKDEGAAINSVVTNAEGHLEIGLTSGESFTISQVQLDVINNNINDLNAALLAAINDSTGEDANLQTQLDLLNQLLPFPEKNALNSGNTYALRIKDDQSGYEWEYVAPFNILDLQPLAWLDAKDISGTGNQPNTGAPINQWVDKSGNNFHAVPQGTGAEIPTYAPIGFNGKPSVLFNDSNLGMTIPFTRQRSNNWTYIFACQQNQQTSGFYDGMYLADQRSRGRLLFNNGLPGTGNLNFKIYQSGFKLNNDLGSNATDVCFFELNAQTGVMNFYRSGVLTDTDNSYFGQDIGNDFTLGNRYTFGNPQLFNGHISEVIIIPRILDASEKTNTLKYLNDKWGL